LNLPQLTFKESADFLQTIPFNALVGLRLVRFHADGVTIGCTMRAELRNAHGMLHGGVSATLVDVAVGVALTRYLGRPRAATTVELKISYLRPVKDGKVTARARLVRVGKNLCTARVDVFNGSKEPAAVALVTYMILKEG
jgi:acyl-CoA thioesterase